MSVRCGEAVRRSFDGGLSSGPPIGSQGMMFSFVAGMSYQRDSWTSHVDCAGDSNPDMEKFSLSIQLEDAYSVSHSSETVSFSVDRARREHDRARFDVLFHLA